MAVYTADGGVLVAAGAAGGWRPGRRWGHAGLHGGAGPLLLLGRVAGGGGAAAQDHVRGPGAALDNTLYCTGGDTVSRHHSTPHPSILSSIIKKCNDDLYMLNNNLFIIDIVVIHKSIYFNFSGVLE